MDASARTTLFAEIAALPLAAGIDIALARYGGG
jgi:hypothetical protein